MTFPLRHEDLYHTGIVVPDLSAATNNAVHHLGYFTDDFDATASALQSQGFALEMCLTVDGETPSMFAYYRAPEAIRVEIVDRNVFGDLAAFLAAFS
jgi:catechol 2,3-dioxygenase-like lactoylglutathione lyase family enzyme